MKSSKLLKESSKLGVGCCLAFRFIKTGFSNSGVSEDFSSFCFFSFVFEGDPPPVSFFGFPGVSFPFESFSGFGGCHD
jgi:hypothetical protein